MDEKKKILIIDDEISVCTLLKNFFNKKGYDTVSANSGKEALSQIKNEEYDVIITDYFLQDTNGIDLFNEIKLINNTVKVIFISGYSDLRIAVELLRMGAYHYLSKPLMPDEILKIVEEAISKKEITAIRTEEHSNVEVQKNNTITTEVKSNKKDNELAGIIYGESPAAKVLEENISLVAPTNMTVVIYGATGTGKESVARRIHQYSKRSAQPFIPIDCGSLSKELAASELFGYEKGAFTGANAAKSGAFEQANGGTIFLDEIGNLSVDVQAYLLRAIQEKKVRRVGAVKTINIDVRIVVASNEDLLHKVANGTFREDLYYRLNEFSISVPLLCERKDDIPLFIRHFVANIAQEQDMKTPRIDDEVMEFLKSYSYPGNVRQLLNILKRGVLLAQKEGVILIEHLPKELFLTTSEKIEINNNIQIVKNNDAIAQFHNPPATQIDHNSLKDSILDKELKIILQALDKTNNNKSKAAKLLNIDRKTLYNKLANVKHLSRD